MIVPLTVQLGSVVTINPSSGDCEFLPNERIDFVPMSAIDADASITSSQEDRPYSEVKKGYTNFVDGDILLAKITPCFENGKISQIRIGTEIGYGSTEFHVLRPDANKLDGRYLVHFLRQNRVRVEGERRMTGSAGQRRVPRSFLDTLPIFLPTLPEQRRIATILDKAESLRARQRKVLAQLDRLAQSIFVTMFGDPMAPTAPWGRVPVSSFVAGFESGKSVSAENEEDTTSLYRVLKVSAVTSLEFKPEECKAAPPYHVPQDSHFVRAGDLLFSRANTAELIGATAYVSEVEENMLLPDKLWRFVWHQEPKATPQFVNYLFRQQKFRSEISRRASGSSGSMKNISQEKVLSIEVSLPPISMQQVFSNRIAKIMEMKTKQIAAVAFAESLFRVIQDRAFRGEL